MAPTWITLQLIGLMLISHSALAIKCYNCESTTDPECAESKKNMKMQAQDCTAAMAAVETTTWIRSLIKLTYFPDAPSINNNMICQTIVGKRGENTTTIRTCQFDAADTDPCEVAKQQLRERQFPASEIISCYTCKEDNCNSMSRKSATYSVGLTLVSSLFLMLNYT